MIRELLQKLVCPHSWHVTLEPRPETNIWECHKCGKTIEVPKGEEPIDDEFKP